MTAPINRINQNFTSSSIDLCVNQGDEIANQTQQVAQSILSSPPFKQKRDENYCANISVKKRLVIDENGFVDSPSITRSSAVLEGIHPYHVLINVFGDLSNRVMNGLGKKPFHSLQTSISAENEGRLVEEQATYISKASTQLNSYPEVFVHPAQIAPGVFLSVTNPDQVVVEDQVNKTLRAYGIHRQVNGQKRLYPSSGTAIFTAQRGSSFDPGNLWNMIKIFKQINTLNPGLYQRLREKLNSFYSENLQADRRERLEDNENLHFQNSFYALMKSWIEICQNVQNHQSEISEAVNSQFQNSVQKLLNNLDQVCQSLKANVGHSSESIQNFYSSNPVLNLREKLDQIHEEEFPLT